MIEATIGKYKRNIAENWNELTPKQVRQIANVFHSAKSHKEAKVKMLRILLDVPFSTFKLLTNVQIINIWDCTDFIFNETRLTQNPYPELSLGTLRGTKLIGPNDKLNNINLLEFAAADSYYIKFCENPDKYISFLYKMVAVLWRPATATPTETDKRIPFSEPSVQQRADLIRKHIKPDQLTAIRIFYYGCRKMLNGRYKNVFEGGEKIKGKSYGWLELINGMAGDKFGDWQATCNTLLHTAFISLDIDMRNQKNLKK
ncbi:hypothetical protein V6R21_32255 [Limibacter armeniacum]|uniref:hypothetical protein n=1 Tax=Limibacter armeniacum TaxID=466084 RepID=UPI002FE53C37